MRKLQSIQNIALRVIFKKDWECKGKELQRLAKIESIKKRMDRLNDKYLDKCLTQQNPLMVELIDEHQNEIERDLACGILLNTSILSKNKYIKQSLRDTGIVSGGN